MKRKTRLVAQAVMAANNATGLIDRHHGAIAELMELRSEVTALLKKWESLDTVPPITEQQTLRRLEYEIMAGDWRQR